MSDWRRPAGTSYGLRRQGSPSLGDGGTAPSRAAPRGETLTSKQSSSDGGDEVRRSTMKREAPREKPAAGSARHDDSHEWVAMLRGPTAVREEALAELHALLLRGARFKLNRSRRALQQVPE